MKSSARKIFSYLGRWPYDGLLELIRFCAKLFDPRFEVWTRNSLQLGYFEPGYSDLDLTLYSPDSKTSVQKFLKFYSFLRSWIPFLGEINCYNPQKLAELKVFGNLFEAQRDPLLFQKMNWGRNPTTVEAAVFLLRQFEKDVHQIEQYPERRLRKWNHHLELVRSFFPENTYLTKTELTPQNLKVSIQFFIIALCEVHNPVLREHVFKNLEFYLEAVYCDLRFYWLNASVIPDSWFYCFALPKMNEWQLNARKINPQQQDFLEFQYKWEMCGLLSQTADLESIEKYQIHLEKVRSSISKLSGGQFLVGAEPINKIEEAALWK